MSPDDLLRLVNRDMPFGRSKGRLIADLPGNYLSWFALGTLCITLARL